jgi:UDP-N-acetylmuramoylalanine--D-glutamate ligase
MLNISPDHLDRHGNITSYVAAKREIFARQTQHDWAAVGTDDEPSRAVANGLEGKGPHLVRISGHDALPKLPATLPGFHNAQNASAALALARAIGAPGEAVLRGLASFPGLPHRMERLGTVAGVEFVNDSKATNASSAATALGCFGRVVWIAGGIAKAGGIESLQQWSKIACAQLIGRDAPMLAETLGRHGVPFDVADTLEAAVPAAFSCARSGEVPVVLLSPACASFDQFANFEARGERFRSLVADLARA